MVTKIILNELEEKFLRLTFTSPENEIKFLPVDLYYSVLGYLEQEERYEDCIKLRDLGYLISNMTVEEYYKVMNF
jgi:hypothetical protein